MFSIYTVAFLCSFAMIIYLMSMTRTKISAYYYMLFSTILLTNFGYMQLSGSSTINEALIANQIVYLGSCFSPYFFLMCLAELCKVRLSRILQSIVMGLGGIIFFLVCTVEHSTLYYKTVGLAYNHGVHYLDKVYGPLHIFYPLLLLYVVTLGFLMIYRAFHHKRDISYKSSTTLLVLLVSIVVVYIGEKLLNYTVELLPVAYVSSQFVLLILLRRITLYDVTLISAVSMMENNAVGFIIYDNKGRFLGADETAKQWFAELNDLLIDKTIAFDGTPLFSQLSKWLNSYIDNEDATVKSGKRYVGLHHSIIKDKRARAIHCVYLEDITYVQEYTRLIEQYNQDLSHDVEIKTQNLRHIQDDIIIGMANIIESRDSNTGGHVARTSEIVKIFINQLDASMKYESLNEELSEAIIKTAPLHDFGKIAIPDEILNKPGKFTPEEYNCMKLHPEKGAVIVEQLLRNLDDKRFKRVAVNIAHYHHERWDGKGYPEGLSGTSIPLEARIMALADVFDALVSKRVYKDSFSFDEAFKIISDNAGSQFDPKLCEDFLQCRGQIEALYSSLTN